jgi:hypothetical protein
MTFEPGALSTDQRVLFIVMSAVFFGLAFVAAGKIWVEVPKYCTFPTAIQADVCSRTGSTLHSVIIVPGLAYGILTMQWSQLYEPLSSCSVLQFFLCISVGYFLSDMVVIAAYRVPQWQVYVFHHVMASSPYIIYLLISSCPYGLFVLSMFLLVEFTNLSLNAQAFLEQFGYGNSNWYVLAIYTTAIGWIPFRIVNPIFLIFTIHTKVFPSIPRQFWWCLIPSTACAYFIVLFCLLGFFMVSGKEVYLRWKKKPTPGDVAEHEADTRAMKVNPKVPLTEEELELTLPSPTRVLIYEARGKVVEMTESFNEAMASHHFGGARSEHSDQHDSVKGGEDQGLKVPGGASLAKRRKTSPDASPTTAESPA